MLLGALSDVFQSWILLGARNDVLWAFLQSWIFCWVLEVMLLGALGDVFSPGCFVGC